MSSISCWVTETFACLDTGGFGPSTRARYSVPADVIVAFQVEPRPNVRTRPRLRSAPAEIRAEISSVMTSTGAYWFSVGFLVLNVQRRCRTRFWTTSVTTTAMNGRSEVPSFALLFNL